MTGRQAHAGVALVAVVLALPLAPARPDPPASPGIEVELRSTAFDGSDPRPLDELGAAPRTRAFSVVAVRRTADAPPQQHDPASHGMLAVAVDAAGAERARRTLADPHLLRAEWPGPDGVLTGRVLYSPSAAFTVALPDDPAIAAIRFFHDAGGHAVPLGEVALPASRLARTAAGDHVTTVEDNGAAANRVDMAVLGDGYTAAQEGDFAADVDDFLDGMFAQEPYREYAAYFNVHRIFVPSNESGADHPERVPAVYRDTAFDATYNCGGVQRLICVNQNKVRTEAILALDLDQRDLILVLVNDSEYGGSGGAIAVASTHTQAVELVLHELGHTFGLLADEYTTQPPVCSLVFEPAAANATREILRERVKWRHWIDPATPVPTLNEQNGVPGVYIGADYCPVGKNRPTPNSKMRALGRPFEAINAEQLVRRTYAFVSPIDEVTPAAETIEMAGANVSTFRVATPTPATHAMTISWLLDDVPVGSGSTITMSAGSLDAGPHSLEVTVQDPTAFVRADPDGVLTATHLWTIVVS